MALDQQYWTRLASKLSIRSLHALHAGLTHVATNDRNEFDAYQDFRQQTDIIEHELAKRGEQFSPIP